MRKVTNVPEFDPDCDCPDCRTARGETGRIVTTDDMAEDFLAKTRRIMLVGEINEISAAHICNQIQFFSLIKDPIYLYINSPGGCMSAGYAIIDQMRASRAPVYTIARGAAHSMGAMILAYGEKGHRFATPNSSIMLHSLIIQNPPDPINSHLQMTDYLQRDWRKKVNDLSKRLKVTPQKLTELMEQTSWFSPSQATKIGLINGIWTPRREQAIEGDLIK